MVANLNLHLSNVCVKYQQEDEWSWRLDVNGSLMWNLYIVCYKIQ